MSGQWNDKYRRKEKKKRDNLTIKKLLLLRRILLFKTLLTGLGYKQCLFFCCFRLGKLPCEQSLLRSSCEQGTSNTVYSPLFFRKIVEIERFALRAAILHECQNYLGGRGRFGRSSFSHSPLLRAIISNARRLGTFENQDGRH